MTQVLLQNCHNAAYRIWSVVALAISWPRLLVKTVLPALGGADKTIRRPSAAENHYIVPICTRRLALFCRRAARRVPRVIGWVAESGPRLCWHGVYELISPNHAHTQFGHDVSSPYGCPSFVPRSSILIAVRQRMLQGFGLLDTPVCRERQFMTNPPCSPLAKALSTLPAAFIRCRRSRR